MFGGGALSSLPYLSHSCHGHAGRTPACGHAELGSLRAEQMRSSWAGLAHRPGGQLRPLAVRMSGIPPLVIL